MWPTSAVIEIRLHGLRSHSVNVTTTLRSDTCVKVTGETGGVR